MKHPLSTHVARHLLTLLISTSLVLSLPAQAAQVALATSPLATSSSSSVSPNIMFMLDDSGSMDWDYMPDTASNFAGKYGFNSAQCNGVAYNPAITYTPPVKSDGTSYPNSSFTNAPNDGFAGGASSGYTNLSTSYPGGSGTGASGSNLATPKAAFYFTYTGSQTQAYQQDYGNTSGTFYRECNSSFGTNPGVSIGSTPGLSVFSYVTVSSTSGPGASDERTNFANWFSYYSTRMMMMKSGVGQAFKSINPSYRVGFMTMNNNVSPDFVDVLPFAGGCSVGSGTCQKDKWYTKLYQANPGSGTPLRQALSEVGNLYANQYATTTIYTATITVSGSTTSSTTVSSVVEGSAGCSPATFTGPCYQLMNASSAYPSGSSNRNNKIATNIAGQINAVNSNIYSASSSSNVVTITGAAGDLSHVPVVTASGGGTFTVTAFVSSTQVAKLNNVVPLDPVQYSCQKNFVILSTDGYWNGAAGYKVDGSSIGNQDSNAPRPYYDGGLVNQTTSQVSETQTQVAQSTSQLLKRIQQVQTRTQQVQTTTSQIQKRTVQNQKRTQQIQKETIQYEKCKANGTSCSNIATCADVTGTRPLCVTASDSGWVNSSTCTAGVSGTGPVVTCQTTDTGWVNVGSCTASSGGGQTVTCQVASDSGWVNASSCTASNPASGPTVTCNTAVSTVATSSCTPSGPTGGQTVTCSVSDTGFVNTSSCTPSGPTGGQTVTCNTTDTGFVGAASCTPSGPTGGQTVSCNTITTGGPTNYVASCTNVAASSSNNYTATNCSTTTLFGPAFVASCTASSASSSNGYVTTTCNPTSTTVNNLSSCTAQVPSSSNNYTTITCTGGSGGTSDTLADTAMYYYQTDLRNPSLGNCTGALGAGTDVCKDNVPSSGTDTNSAQHMTTFTLGLGARGKMVYSSTYKSDTSGDYYSVAAPNPPNTAGYILANSSPTPPVCSWESTGQICNWPTPVSNTNTAIDDLWHAAVDGRGAYYSATDPATLSSGLASTLSAINQVTGAAAAAATSTLNPVTGNNFAYVASYTTVKWIGNLEQRTIDTTTGVVSTTASWCVENLAPPTCVAPNFIVSDTSGSSTVNYCAATAIDANGDGTIDASDCTAPMVFDSATTTCRQPINNTCVGTLPPMVAATSDTRTIYTANSAGTALIPFDAAYATANPANFSAAHISGLTQWPALVAAGTSANATGVNLINYLRGQTGYEANRTSNPTANWLYRYRDAVMGDALESQPTFVAAPTYSYVDPGYSSFVAAHLSRPGTVYIGTNDGMLHAFKASNGVERWAFVPSAVIPNMWRLADSNYGTQHVNFVNGSPVISDICTANCTNAATAVWKTIIVGGLNAGGREYYALDITDPTAPSLLWEFTPAKDANLGYSYGRPVITKKQDGTWVVLVSSGYDNGTLSSDNATLNSPAGNGMGYLYVLNATDGSIISAIGTGVGTAATPSGLARFNAYSDVEGTNQAGFVYGGDLLGNLWRFNINTAAAPFALATLADPSGVAQPITVAPTLGISNGKRLILVGTGKYLETGDLSNTQRQTIYGIVDDDATVTLVNPAGSPRNSNTLIQQTISNASSTTRSDTSNSVDLSAYRGWYVGLPDSGERANVDFKLVQGTLLVPTIVPSSTACSPGGYGWLNYFNYETGGPVDSTGIVSQYYDSPIVGMNVIYIGGNPLVEIVTSNNPTPTPPPTEPPFRQGSGGFTQSREVWRELIP